MENYNVTDYNNHSEAVTDAIKNGFTTKGLDHYELFNNHRTQKFSQVLYSETQGVKIVTKVESGKLESMTCSVWTMEKETNNFDRVWGNFKKDIIKSFTPKK